MVDEIIIFLPMPVRFIVSDVKFSVPANFLKTGFHRDYFDKLHYILGSGIRPKYILHKIINIHPRINLCAMRLIISHLVWDEKLLMEYVSA